MLISGGVALTVMTGGVAAVVVGSIAVGGGASMITNPISKVVFQFNSSRLLFILTREWVLARTFC